MKWTIEMLREAARQNISKHALIVDYEAKHPGTRIDTAVPQAWADANEGLVGAFGWIYDEHAPIFGRPFDLRPLIEREVGEVTARSIEDGALDMDMELRW